MISKGLVVWFVLIGWQTGLAKPKVSILQYVFLYSTVKHMEWPRIKKKEFVVSIFGKCEVHQELISISRNRAAAGKMMIKKVDSLEMIIKIFSS